MGRHVCVDAGTVVVRREAPCMPLFAYFIKMLYEETLVRMIYVIRGDTPKETFS